MSNDVLFPDEPAGAALSAIATAQSLVARRCSIGRGSLDANQTVVISFASAALACAVTLGCGTELPPPSTSGDTTFDGGEEQVAPNESTSTSDGGSKLAPSSAADGVSPRVCSIPTIEDEAEPRAFESLSATVIDEEGTAIPDLLAQACGMNVCLQAKTDSLGRVTISQDEEIAKLAFKYGDGLRYAQIVVAMPEGERHDLGAQATLRLPTGDPNNRLESGASLESSDARLELDPDTDIKLDRLSYPDEADYVFVAREFERDVLPSSIAAQNFAAVWVLGPQKTEFCPAAKLSVPNTTELGSGSPVDLYLLVTGIDGHFAAYTEWGKVGTATVSSDGLRIETDPDSGLPELGIIGFRSPTDPDITD